MKLYFLPLMAASLISFHSAQAADFSEELRIDYAKDKEDAYSNDLITVRYFHYLDKVNTSNGPLAEAPFLSKASSIYVGIGSSDSDYSHGLKSSGNVFGAGITYVTPDQPIVLKAKYTRLKEDLDSPYLGDFTIKASALGAGYYLNDSTMAFFNIDKSTATGFLTGNAKTYTFSTKHLADLGNSRALNIEAAVARNLIEDDENQTVISMIIDYYPQPSFSVGTEVSTLVSGDEDGTSLTLKANAFIRENLQLALGYSDNRIDDSDIDSTELSLSLTARF